MDECVVVGLPEPKTVEANSTVYMQDGTPQPYIVAEKQGECMRRILHGKCMVEGYELRGWVCFTLANGEEGNVWNGTRVYVQISNISSIAPRTKKRQ